MIDFILCFFFFFFKLFFACSKMKTKKCFFDSDSISSTHDVVNTYYKRPLYLVPLLVLPIITRLTRTAAL